MQQMGSVHTPFRLSQAFDSLEDRPVFVMPLLRHADCLLVFPTYLQLQPLLGSTALLNLAPMPIEERRGLRLSRLPTLVSCHPHCLLFSVTIEHNLDGLS